MLIECIFYSAIVYILLSNAITFVSRIKAWISRRGALCGSDRYKVRNLLIGICY